MSLRKYPKRVGPTVLPIAGVNLFTAPEPLILTDVLFTNSHTAAVEISLHIVPKNGVASASNAVVKSLSILPKNIYELTQQNVPLNTDETLRAVPNVDNVMNVTLTLTDVEGETIR